MPEPPKTGLRRSHIDSVSRFPPAFTMTWPMMQDDPSLFKSMAGVNPAALQRQPVGKHSPRLTLKPNERPLRRGLPRGYSSHA